LGRVDSNRFLLASESSPNTSRVEICARFRFVSTSISGEIDPSSPSSSSSCSSSVCVGSVPKVDEVKEVGLGAAKGVELKGEEVDAKAELDMGGNALGVEPNAPFEPNALPPDPNALVAVVEVELFELNEVPNPLPDPNAPPPPPAAVLLPNASNELWFTVCVSSVGGCCDEMDSVVRFQLKLPPPPPLDPLVAPPLVPLPLPLPRSPSAKGDAAAGLKEGKGDGRSFVVVVVVD
jgi:hypothetical protein